MDADSFRNLKRVLITLVLVNYVLTIVGAFNYRNVLEQFYKSFGLEEYSIYGFVAFIGFLCVFNSLLLWTVIVENNCLVAFFMVIYAVGSVYEAFNTGAVLASQNEPFLKIFQILALFARVTMTALLVAFFRALQAVRLNGVRPQPNCPSSLEQFGSSETFVVGSSSSKIASKPYLK